MLTLARREKRRRHSLQPAVAEFAIRDFLRRATAEVECGQLSVLATHSLIKARAREDVRVDQTRVVLTELADALNLVFASTALDDQLTTILAGLRKLHPAQVEYAAGNVINLMVVLGLDLRAISPDSGSVRPTSRTRTFGIRHSRALTSTRVPSRRTSTSCCRSRSHPRANAAGTANGVVRLWDASSTERRGALHGHTARIRAVAFSPDGALIVSSSDDGSVRLWHAGSGECLTVLSGHRGRVRTVAFAPDGTTLASAGQDRILRLWSIPTGELRAELTAHETQIRAVCFAPGGSWIASGGDDGALRILDTASGAVLRTISAHTDRTLCVAVSPNGLLAATGGGDKAVRLWEAFTGALLWSGERHTRAVRSVTFDRTGNALATASEDQTVRLWDVQSGDPTTTLLGHTNRVYSVSCSADNRALASGSEDHTVRVWDVARGHPIATITGHTNWVWAVSYAPDGRHLVTGGDDRLVRFFDTAALDETAELRGHVNRVRALAVTPHGNLLATCSDDETVRLWSVANGAHMITMRGHTGRVRSVAFSPDGRLLASGSDDQTVRVWSSATGELLRDAARPQRVGSSCRVRARSRCGRQRRGGRDDHDLGSLRCESTRQLGWTPFQDPGNRLSPAGDRFASVGDDDAIRVWNASDGALLAELRSGVDSMRAIRYSPDGMLLSAVQTTGWSACGASRPGESPCHSQVTRAGSSPSPSVPTVAAWPAQERTER